MLKLPLHHINDLPAANPDKIKKSLSEQGILVEDWGGKIQCAMISAKKVCFR